IFFFSSRRRHTRLQGDWSSDVCSSDLAALLAIDRRRAEGIPVGILVAAREPVAVRIGDGAIGAAAVAGPEVGADSQAEGLLEGRSEERRVGKEGGWGGAGVH